jgi:hypothetical protein
MTASICWAEGVPTAASAPTDDARSAPADRVGQVGVRLSSGTPGRRGSADADPVEHSSPASLRGTSGNSGGRPPARFGAVAEPRGARPSGRRAFRLEAPAAAAPEAAADPTAGACEGTAPGDAVWSALPETRKRSREGRMRTSLSSGPLELGGMPARRWRCPERTRPLAQRVEICGQAQRLRVGQAEVGTSDIGPLRALEPVEDPAGLETWTCRQGRSQYPPSEVM